MCLPTPRKHQDKDLGLLRGAIGRKAKRILFEAACGYGKSVVIQIIAISYARAGKRVLVLANRTAVVDQLAVRAAGEENIDVMTVQTADARRKRGTLDEYDVILIDEAHMGAAGAQYGRVIDSSPDALLILFTGTPKPELFEIAPCHIEGHGAQWLTDNGFLAPLRPFCPDRTDLRKARTRNGDFLEEDILAEVESKDICGDAIKSYKEHCKGRPTLLFAINKKHARDVAEEFAAAGIESRVLLGGDNDVDEKLAWIKDGGLLIAVDKVSAGFDLPDLHAIISLRPTKSAHLWVQQLGRAARAADGKLSGLVFDHVGNFRRCGTLTEIRDWKNGDQQSDEKVTEDGERLSGRRCDVCFYYWLGTGAICPECDHDNGADLRISKKKAIEIKEQSIAEIEEARRQAGLAARQAQGRAKSFKALVEEKVKSKGTKNRHSARYAAMHVLEARIKKAAQAGRLDEARAIQADLATNGFHVEIPGHAAVDDLMALIEADS